MRGKNKRDNKTKYLLVLLLLIAVGYAAIATTLKINGSSTIKSAKWDVYWENPHVIDGSVTNTAPTLSESDTKATFDVTLNEPGDYYEFTIDAVNNGSLDAKIDTDGIVKQVKNASGQVVNPTILKYEVTNNDAGHTAIQEGHILAKKSGNTPTKETYRVRVEYRNDDEIDPTDLDDSQDLVFTIEFSVKYVQGPKTTPVTINPYLTTFDGNYTYKGPESEEFGALNNEWGTYIRTDGTKPELCGVFGSGQAGTVCLTSSYYNADYSSEGSYESDFEDCSTSYEKYDGTGETCLKGYMKSKIDEILSKGVSSCNIEGNNYVSCLVGPGFYFYSNGNIVYGDDQLVIYNDGTVY